MLDFRKQRIKLDQHKKSVTLFEYLVTQIVAEDKNLSKIDQTVLDAFIQHNEEIRLEEKYDTNISEDDKPFPIFIKALAQLISDSYDLEDKYTQKITNLQSLQSKGKLPIFNLKKFKANGQQYSTQKKDEQNDENAYHITMLFDELFKNYKGQFKGKKGGTFQNMKNHLKKFTDLASSWDEIEEMWKNFMDYNKRVSVIKKINDIQLVKNIKQTKFTEQGEDDQRDEKQNQEFAGDRCTIIDIVKNYYKEQEFDILNDYQIQFEIQQWLKMNASKQKTDDENYYTFRDVLDAVVKKFKFINSDQLFTYHKEQIDKTQQGQERDASLKNLYYNYGREDEWKKYNEENKIIEEANNLEKQAEKIKKQELLTQSINTRSKNEQVNKSISIDQETLSDCSNDKSKGNQNSKQEQQAQNDQKQLQNDQTQKIEEHKKKVEEFEKELEGKQFIINELKQFERQSKDQPKQRVFSRKYRKRNTYYCCSFDQVFFVIQELISGLDFISDIIILREYINSGHNAWLTINVFSIISPIFVSYVTLVTLIIKNYYRKMNEIKRVQRQQEKDRLNEEKHQNIYQSMSQDESINNLVQSEEQKQVQKTISLISTIQKLNFRIKSFIPVTPLVIVYLFIIEIVYLINSTIIVPIIFILKILTCGYCDKQFKCIELSFKKLYDVLFDMKDSEVDGFRRLRSITQLTFESTTQIMLQYRILQYSRNFPDERKKFGISDETIMLSLVFAILHGFTELVGLVGEKVAFKSESFTHYMSTCFNCRYGFVPYANILKQRLQQDQNLTQPKESKNGQKQQNKVLSYEQFKFFGKGSQIDYKFSEETFEILIREVSGLPIVRDAQKRYILRFGESIKDIKITQLISLLTNSFEKVEVKIQEDILGEIIEKGTEFTKQMRDKNQNVEPHINKLVEKGQFQIVEKMIKLGAFLEYEYKKGDTMVDRIIKRQPGYKSFMGALQCTDNENLKLLIEKKMKYNESYKNLRNQLIEEGDEDEIKSLALSNQPLSQYIQNEILKEALKQLREDFKLQIQELQQQQQQKDGTPDLKPQQKNSLKALRILAFIFGRDIRIKKDDNDNDPVETALYKYLNTTYKQKFDEVEFVEFRFEEQLIIMKDEELFKFNQLRQKVIDQLFDEDQNEGFIFAQQLQPISIDDLKISPDQIIEILDIIICKNWNHKRQSYRDDDRITRLEQLDNAVKKLGLDKDEEMYYSNSRELCNTENMNRILEVKIRGIDVQEEVEQLRSNGQYKRDTYVERESIVLDFKALKIKPDCFSSMNYLMELRDSESGLQTSSLGLNFKQIRSFQQIFLRGAQYGVSPYPYYQKQIDADSIYEDERKVQKFTTYKDLFAALKNVETLTFVGRTKNKPGNKFILKNFYLSFVLHYPYGIDLGQAKDQFEQMLNEQFKFILQRNSDQDKEQ